MDTTHIIITIITAIISGIIGSVVTAFVTWAKLSNVVAKLEKAIEAKAESTVAAKLETLLQSKADTSAVKEISALLETKANAVDLARVEGCLTTKIDLIKTRQDRVLEEIDKHHTNTAIHIDPKRDDNSRQDIVERLDRLEKDVRKILVKMNSDDNNGK